MSCKSQLNDFQIGVKQITTSWLTLREYITRGYAHNTVVNETKEVWTKYTMSAREIRHNCTASNTRDAFNAYILGLVFMC